MLDIISIAVLFFLLVVFAVDLYYKYRNVKYAKYRTVKPVVPEPVSDGCAICGKKEYDQVFCPRCERRLTLKYAAILLGVLSIPVGALLGYVCALCFNTPVGASVFAGAGVVIVVYNILTFSYFIIYHRKRVHVGILFIEIDPVGISFSFRGLLREFSLLFKQKRGILKTELLRDKHETT